MKAAWSVLALSSALLLARCRGPSAQTERTTEANAFVAAREVNVVDQPESPRVIGRLRPGTSYPIIKRGGPGTNWCKVHVDNADGWLLCTEASSATAPPPPPPPSPPANTAGAPPSPGPTPTGSGFAYWMLTLSWSPSFCATPAGSRNSEQCDGTRHYGFVVHGLWPQNERGWPSSCPTGAGPSKDLVSRTLDIMPSAQLVEHEWEKHGACSGLGAEDYFAKVRAAFGSIRIPDAYLQPKTAFTTNLEEIVSAFTAANPRLDRSALAVECSGELDEVRICLDKQLAPRPCGSDVRTACKGKVTVPPLR